MLNREDKTGARRVRIHALGFPGQARRAADHEHPLRDADADALREERRDVRRPERARQLCPLTVAVRPCDRCAKPWKSLARRRVAALAATSFACALLAGCAADRVRGAVEHPDAADHEDSPGRGPLHTRPSSATRCTRKNATEATTRSPSARRSPRASSALMDAMFERVVPVAGSDAGARTDPQIRGSDGAGARGLRLRDAGRLGLRRVRGQPQVPDHRLQAGRAGRSTPGRSPGYGAAKKTSMLVRRIGRAEERRCSSRCATRPPGWPPSSASRRW